MRTHLALHQWVVKLMMQGLVLDVVAAVAMLTAAVVVAVDLLTRSYHPEMHDITED